MKTKNIKLTRNGCLWGDSMEFIHDNPGLHPLCHLVAKNILVKLQLNSHRRNYILFSLHSKILSWEIGNQKIVIALLLTALSIMLLCFTDCHSTILGIALAMMPICAATAYLQYQKIYRRYYYLGGIRARKDDELFIRFSYGLYLIYRLQSIRDYVRPNPHLQTIHSIEDLEDQVEKMLEGLANRAKEYVGESAEESSKETMREIVDLSFAALLFASPDTDEKARSKLAHELYSEAFGKVRKAQTSEPAMAD